MAEPLVTVEGLTVAFGTREVVRNVSFDLFAGELLGIVGGSGSGKTTTLRAILGHLPRGAAITAGAIRFRGQDMLALPPRERRRLRGSEIATIVQDPVNALSPLRSVGRQMTEIAADHGKRLEPEEIDEHLRSVGINEPRRAADGYPYELSGGMAQRVLIAMALALQPSVIVADEPTSALDVTIQAQIMELLRETVRERGLAVLFVTHDIALVGDHCARTVVMREGEIVEQGPVEEVLFAPRREYTRALVAAARPPRPLRGHGVEATP